MARSIFKYYGSKHRIIPHYPAPRYDLIVEPFAGSASYSLRYPDRDVLLCETDLEVAELWRGLLAAAPAEVRDLPVNLEVGLDIRTLPIPLWAQLLIRYRQRVGMSKCWTVSSWGNCKGFWTAHDRDGIAARLPGLKHWQVFHGSIVDAPISGEATWFVDPPYEAQATVYKNEAPDFPALGRWCQQLSGQVIVCETPFKDGTLPTWLPFRHLTMARVGPSGSGKSHAERSELIWTNDET